MLLLEISFHCHLVLAVVLPANRQLIWCDLSISATSVGLFLFLYFEDRVSSSRGR